MYVDSGSGSMIISAVVAGAAGSVVAAKMGWRKMTGGLRKGAKPDTGATATTDTEQN